MTTLSPVYSEQKRLYAKKKDINLGIDTYMSPIKTDRQCCALTKTYTQCAAKAKYRCDTFIRMHIHTPLCKKHGEEFDKTRNLERGVIYDSDLYMKKNVKRSRYKHHNKSL